ncbi:LysM peptidoglycan-binding domain-containing protein [Liquorilactobacillus mali]|uniref:Peptidoglycan binding protein, LysM domain containing protein n=1 Tax=Liquorilactobacillus mali TaxID=1618 RepID=A0A0R2FKY2_9LACO|nr:LysM peptidoglycan-binding domain-containing protein [Liquorilactobacillus mali]KRN26997.1 peptidoglycan binding protein, LysM domain containing protein [Liquorilactobacillus mali]
MNISGITSQNINSVGTDTSSTQNSQQADKTLFSSILENNLSTELTVKNGDTLWAIAKKYGTSISDLAKSNNIANPDLIYVNQRINISGSSTEATATQKAQTAYGTTTSLTTGSAGSVQGTSDSTQNSSESSQTSNLSDSEKIAQDYIVQHESGGDYNARNGKYIGKYQLDSSYLNGDYSVANQEKVAEEYVTQRYGSWTKAMEHWKENNWY